MKIVGDAYSGIIPQNYLDAIPKQKMDKSGLVNFKK